MEKSQEPQIEFVRRITGNYRCPACGAIKPEQGDNEMIVDWLWSGWAFHYCKGAWHEAKFETEDKNVRETAET